MFMRVNSKCAHQLRPPPGRQWTAESDPLRLRASSKLEAFVRYADRSTLENARR